MRTILSGLFLLLFCCLKSIFDPSWTTPDNLYYVGSKDLASYLVVTTKGNILINANLASSPPQIRASVEKLGFHWSDTKILLNSQAQSDHIGGAAERMRF
jgi:metallo-beta-lactamase class B